MLRAGSASVALHLGALLLGVLTTVLLGRAMGATGYGIYAFAYSVVMVLTIPVQAGVPTLVMRESARLGADANYGLIFALWKWSGRLVVACALIAVVLGVLIALTLDPMYRSTLLVSTALIPLLALSAVRSAALKGLHHVILGQLPDIIIRPLLLFAGVAIFYLLGRVVSPELTMTVHVLGGLGAFLVGALLLKKHADVVLSAGVVDTSRSKRAEWRQSILPLSGVNALQVVNANVGIVALGILASASEVGLFKVAATVGGVLMFGRTAVISIVQPRMAVAHQKKDHSELQRLAGMVSLASFATTLVVLLGLLAIGQRALPFAFGQDFAAAWPVLLLIGAGQLVNSFFASVGSCLTMARREKLLLRSLVLVSTLSIPVYFILSSQYGALGASLAMALHTSALHILYWRIARDALGVDASPTSYVLSFLVKSDTK